MFFNLVFFILFKFFITKKLELRNYLVSIFENYPREQFLKT